MTYSFLVEYKAYVTQSYYVHILNKCYILTDVIYVRYIKGNPENQPNLFNFLSLPLQFLLCKLMFPRKESWHKNLLDIITYYSSYC